MQMIKMIAFVGLTLMCMSVAQGAAPQNGYTRYVPPFERYILQRLFSFETSTVSQVNSLAEQVEDLAADVDALESCVEELKLNVTTLDAGLTDLESIVSNLSTTTEQQQMTLDNLDLSTSCNCTDFENRITSLENDVTNLMQMVEQLANNTDGEGETVEEGTIRLVGSIDPMEGRVEVYLMGMWGTVCDAQWTIGDATVACAQLGLAGGTPILAADSPYGMGTGPIWLGNLVCAGTETRLVDCSSGTEVGVTGCDHSQDAALTCSA